jgi:hypothetical protein
LPGYERDEQEPTPFRMGRTLYTKLLWAWIWIPLKMYLTHQPSV